MTPNIIWLNTGGWLIDIRHSKTEKEIGQENHHSNQQTRPLRALTHLTHSVAYLLTYTQSYHFPMTLPNYHTQCLPNTTTFSSIYSLNYPNMYPKKGGVYLQKIRYLLNKKRHTPFIAYANPYNK